jgi:hypothetical protein
MAHIHLPIGIKPEQNENIGRRISIGVFSDVSWGSENTHRKRIKNC